MTSILNKLVSACQTIEANGGSGGGSGSSEYQTSSTTLDKSSFSNGKCYVPICPYYSTNNAMAKIYIDINGADYHWYYIEVDQNKIGNKITQSFRVFKNSSAPTDSTELTFYLCRCTHKDVSGFIICLEINGIDTITKPTFNIYKLRSYNGNLPADGDAEIKHVDSDYHGRFVSVGPSA